MSTDSSSLRVGFLGAGQMARALAGGLLSAEFLTASQMAASDISAAARHQFADETGANAHAENRIVASGMDVLVLAVKPQYVPAVLEEIRPELNSHKLIISIAAGISLARLHELAGGQGRWIRVMPNTPALIGAAASAFSGAPSATDQDRKLVAEILATIGRVVEVSEPLLDAVTGLSGSGPAYAYQIIEALSDGGVRQGLPRPIATQLAAQTLLGAARMVLETEQHPGVLKDAVTSPAGTTIAGLNVLEQRAVRGALMAAVEAASERSRELGRS